MLFKLTGSNTFLIYTRKKGLLFSPNSRQLGIKIQICAAKVKTGQPPPAWGLDSSKKCDGFFLVTTVRQVATCMRV